MNILRICLVVGLAASTGSLCAQTVFTDRSAFLSELSTYTLESFESYADDEQSTSRPIDFAAFSLIVINVEGTGVTSVPVAGTGPTDGLKYFNFIPFSTTNSATFVFDVPLYAFGLDIKDAEVSSLQYQMRGGQSGVAATPGDDGNVQFFGVVSSQPFTSIRFFNPDLFDPARDRYSFDSVVMSAVPEVPSSGLAVIGVLATVVASWRRRASSRGSDA